MSKILLFVLASLLSVETLAESGSISYIEGCKNIDGDPTITSFMGGVNWGFDSGKCLGVIEGVSGMMRLAHEPFEDGNICLPPNYNNNLGEQAVLKYAANNPDEVKINPPVILVALALFNAYGCPK